MQRLRVLTLLLSLVIAALAGCQSGGSGPAPSATEVATPGQPSASNAYPDPASASSAYPSADDTSPSAHVPTQGTPVAADASGQVIVSTPADSTKANLGGTLIRLIPGQESEPFRNVVLYLGEVLYDSNGQKAAAGMTEQSPRTETDGQGNFLFENVPPGEYAIFYWTPVGSVMLLEPGTTNDQLFNLKPGDAINVGRLEYDIPY